jgi:alkanesulfonate monooxygenase SsuD/methylene tetrahydromethanopterin reductase-like flavin-dependent oxidoreductase (luciferase family)
LDSALHVCASRRGRARVRPRTTSRRHQRLRPQRHIRKHNPPRLYTEFATLDAASNGRAQLIVGRASSVESFPLFGFDLADYETLFEEKLDLFTRLLRDQPVTWSGTVRPPLTDQYVGPAIAPGHIPTWVGVGGSPQSMIRAARYGLRCCRSLIPVR